MPKNAPQKSKSTENDLVTNKNIIAILGNNVAASPSNIAIYDEEGSIDYQELHNRSNQLAHYIFNHKPSKCSSKMVGKTNLKSEWFVEEKRYLLILREN
jgi:non-ribosomal peptide synthetase component F